MFQELLQNINSNLLEKLFHIEIVEEDFNEDAFMTRRTRPRKMTTHHASLDHNGEEVEESGPSTVRREKPKIGRNAPCWCGSGKKYKKCHLNEDLKAG